MSEITFWLAIFGVGFLPIIHILCCRSPPKESTDSKAGGHEAGSSGSAPAIDEGDRSYLVQYGTEIEEGLGAALKEVISKKSATPLEAIGKLLSGPQSSMAMALTKGDEPNEMSLEDKIDELRTMFPGKTTDALRKMLLANGGDVKLTRAACRELV